MAADSEDSEGEELGLIRPKFLGELRNVLHEYPDDGQILKEMIQNAEDAGAKTIKIIADRRHFSENVDKALLKKHPHLMFFKGPALCVYNDAYFTEDDWKGIRMLHTSIKETDPLKVGRFGLGFKSVFHLTDRLVIMSGDRIMYMDPFKGEDRYCNSKRLAERKGVELHSILNALGGTFGISQQTFDSGTLQGTLFWFPLRNAPSELSQTVYSEKNVEDLMNAFRAEARTMILFLKNIESICLSSRHQDHSLKDEFKVTVHSSCLQNVRAQRRSFIAMLQQAKGSLLRKSIHSQNELAIETVDYRKSTRTNIERWLVVNYHPGARDISAELSALCADPHLAYQPLVGVAVPLTSHHGFQSHIFCFLPLPLDTVSPTGLPVHVNGFFALSQNRRHIKWPSADQQNLKTHTEPALRWNCLLVEEVLPRAYGVLLHRLKELCITDPTLFYKAWPDSTKVVDKWRPLLGTLYKEIASKDFFYTDANKGSWISLGEAVHGSFPGHLDPDVVRAVTKVYNVCNENLVTLPRHVEVSLEEYGFKPARTVSPEHASALVHNCFEQLDASEKLLILQYLLSHHRPSDILTNLQLLPLENGSFGKFDRRLQSSSDQIYWCDERLMQLLPGLGDRFCDARENREVREKLRTIAKSDVFNFQQLQESSIILPRLFERSLQIKLGNGPAVLCPRESETWIERIWNFLSTSHPWSSDLTSFLQINLLPDIYGNRFSLVPLNRVYVCGTIPGMNALSKDLISCLSKLQVKVLTSLPVYVTKHSQVLGKLVQYPSNQGVTAALIKVNVNNSLRLQAIQTFNASGTKEERIALTTFLNESDVSVHDMKSLLQALKLFTEAKTNTTVSFNEINVIGPQDLPPVRLPGRYLTCTQVTRRVALSLGASEETLVKLVQTLIQTATEKLTPAETTTLMKYFLDNKSLMSNQALLSLAKEIQFVPTKSGQLLKARELYDPDCQLLVALFTYEERFPIKEFSEPKMLMGLRKLGLRNESSLSEDDLIATAKIIDTFTTHINSTAALSIPTPLINKANALWKLLSTHGHNIQMKTLDILSNLQCLPCLQKEQNSTEYPPDLPLRTESVLVKPMEMCLNSSMRLFGSVLPVMMPGMPNSICKHLGVGSQENIDNAFQHLKNVINHFSISYSSQYQLILCAVFHFLSEHRSNSKIVKALQANPCVMIESEGRFAPPNRFWVQKARDDIDLRPYRFILPMEMSKFSDLFLTCGSSLHQDSTLLQSVLTEIQQKHSHQQTTDQDFRIDMRLVKQILDILKTCKSVKKGTIIIPVYHDQDNSLHFRQAKDCTIGQGTWQMSYSLSSGEEEVWFVHPDIPQSTALALGALSMKERALTGAEELDFGYGQHEELTNRLHNLLKDSYTDGFSVPKELIQNADDAGATEIKFLLDERENRDCRTNLITERMASLQGPALWAFNNSVFSDKDFENIVKLGGGTKREDAAKVGKFGLGFNSVYNLTDAPSFISRHIMAVFDPQVKYLEGAGLKLDFKKPVNHALLRKMPETFKPFQGIFGCRLQKEKEVCYNGTLFRFPLRTPDQAENSKLKAESYSPEKRKEFLKMLLNRGGSLLMFTQRIQRLEVYYIHENCDDPTSASCLLTVTKHSSQELITPAANHINEQSILQFCTAQWSMNPDIKIREFVDIHVRMMDSATAICNVRAGLSTTKWCIAWATGTGQSAEIARKHKEEGLIPLAAAGVPMKDGCIETIANSPDGFYRTGHLFCFLPLPEEMVRFPLFVHLNGTFALSSNRRGLHIQTEDDLQSAEGTWNLALFADAICRAYLLLLESLQSTTSGRWLLNYFEFWPKGEDEMNLTAHFFKHLESDGNKVLPTTEGKEWTSFQNALFLDPDFMESTCGEIAWKTLQKFRFAGNKKLVNVPVDISRCMKASCIKHSFEGKVLGELYFYKTIFFPRIDSNFWEEEERDKLVFQAVMHKDPAIQDLVRDSECIPCSNSDILRKPSDLVHPEKLAAKLFLESDSFFPKNGNKIKSRGQSGVNFCSAESLEHLVQLGMMTDSLPEEMLLDRAKSVASLSVINYEEAKTRAHNIIEYLSSICEKGFRFNLYSLTLKESLSKTEFLPILPKPGNWPFPWAGSDRNIKLAAPSDIFSDNLKDLVACSAKILDLNTGTSYRWALRSNKNVYNWLGLTTEENHQDTDLIILVISQLQAISGFYPQCKQRDKELVEIICNKIYAFLNRCCMAPSHPDTVAILSEENSVWTGNQFVPPLKVAFDCKYNCRPYLYQLENPLKQYLSLCEALGVKKTFSKDDAISAINAIHEEYHQLKLSEEKIQLMSRLAQLLCDAVKQDQSKEDIGEMKIFLPDRHGYLQPVGNLCLDDCPWLSESESMKFVHESISPGTAKVLGVQTKREMDYNILVDMIPFGQSEKLTNRIKRLLQGYTCDSSLFKELLQNADDAGATEIKFIKDFRSLKTERVPSGWENIQGPSLCIYNNSSFTSKDMQGIQCLGEGSKGQDLLKTGKYGVGFNAVYHLTDVPSFWTRLDEKEPIICVFDPNCKYVKNATLQNPGAMFKNIDRVKQEYPDMFSGYLENIVVMSEPGTLFRLPLRTEEMARKSDIKSVAVTPKYVGQLLDEFKSEMKICLLFLNNLRKISICSLDENCDLSLEYEVNMNLSKHDSHQLNIYKGYVQQMLRNIQDGNLSLGNAEYFEIILNAILRDTKGSEEEWIIVNSAGFKTPNLLSSSLLEEWKKEHFQLLPRGGVALKLSSKKFHKEKHPPFSTQEMHAFCILPLPIKTKLPVHVNGHFALDHETRRGLWNHEDDAQTEWNENIAAELIVPAYIAAIKQARCRWFSMTKPVPSSLDLDARLEWYHHLFPDFEDSPSDFWRNMIKKLYIRIAQHEINLFPVRLHNLEWSPVVKRGGFPGYFNNLVDFYKQQSKHSTTNSHLVLSNYSCSQASFHASDDERFRKKAEKMKALLKKLNMKVLEMPYRIFKNFLNCGIDGVREISPMSVIQFLKSSCRSSTDGCNLHGLPLQLKDTPIQTAENVKLLVTFVKKEPSFLENLEGLPLCLRQSGTLTVFHDAEESDKPVVSDFYTLLPGSASAFVHKEIYSYFNINSETAKRFVRKLSIPIAANLLPQTLAVANFKTEHAIIHDPKTFPSTEWLKEFWKFIESQVMLYTGNCETDILTLENEISLLAAWSLIPVKQKFGGNDFDVLYPVKYMNIVVYLTKDDDPSNSRLWNILQTLPLPFLDNSHLPHITVLTRLVASISNPMALLQSLIQESIECPQEHAYIILSYFDNTLRVLQKTFTSKKLLIDTIKKLPFFTSIDGSLMSCKAASRILCLPDCIPKDGLTSWSKAQSLTLLQKEFVPPNLSTYLGFIVPNITEFYCNDLLTTLVYLPRNAIISHMTFLKSYSCPEDEKKKLECHLQTTAFIEMNNQLHMASEYYLPSEPVFKAMLPPTSFPPAPFSNPDWNHFMKLAGINHCVTSEMFIHFAEEVQEEGTLLCSEKTQEKSYILVQHLFGRNDLTSSHLLSEVSEIRFVCQSKWWLESEGQLLRLIVRPYSNDRLISFSESCPTQHLHLVWSSSCLIDERASPLRQEFASLAKRQQVLDQLKFKELVPMEKVLCHVRNVCLSLAGDLCQVMCSLHTDLMTMVMSDIYGFLDKLTLSAAVIKELQNLPIICHIDRKRMFKPENVVLYLGEEQAIEDHIEQYPTVFGAYFKFFEKLGSVQKVTANHYAKVLLFLKKQVKDNTLHVKEIIIAKKAVEGLFRCLKSPSKEEKQISVKSLYLPTEDYYLHKSNELIFKDDAYLTKMLPQEQRDMNTFFFIGFEKLKIKTPQPLDEVLLLPDNHRMVWLSTIVKQVVPNHIKSAATVTENSQRLARTLADPKRINGLIRLVYHQCKKDEKEFNQNTADQIVKSLSHINIVEVADLRVCLEYKNEIVKDSSRQVYSFTEKNTCDVRKCTVYLAKCACLAWEESQDRFEHELANAIEFVLNTSLSNYHLHDILKNPTKATATMDEDGIETCNFTDNIEHSAFPLLGTFVPVDQHCYLDNGFSDFSVGEYVGYELYDPQLDTGDEDETDAVFIYARVLRLEAEEWANEQLLNTKYCICLSPDGREAVVSATKLYKFIRKLSEDEDSDDDVPHPHDISVVLREIRRTLTEAWDGLDETDRKRVVKRLYLKWFPDGDVNKDFCDRVLQKIQHYVNLLENGGTFNVESGEETDLVSIRGRRRTIMTTTFFHRMYRRGKRRSEFYSQSARGASAGDFIQRTYNACLQIYDHSSKPNPQPGEGRRWLRQAKADLSAALSSMNCVQEYNWICFQCHQAVEKALKAILYYRDSSGESELRSHEIVWLANSARDNDLLQLVRDLERCVGSNMRMRYPDMLDYPKIPHDVYTSDQATRACALADQIVKRIQHLLQE